MKNKIQISSPLGIALWLIKEGLTLEQISEFCEITRSEIERLNVSQSDMSLDIRGIRAINPIDTLDLTKEEIQKCLKDKNKKLEHAFHLNKIAPGLKIKKSNSGISLSYEQKRSRPNVIAYLIGRGLPNSIIKRIAKTTYNTIDNIRESINSIETKDPVIMGFCTQMQLDKEIELLDNVQ